MFPVWRAHGLGELYVAAPGTARLRRAVVQTVVVGDGGVDALVGPSQWPALIQQRPPDALRWALGLCEARGEVLSLPFCVFSWWFCLLGMHAMSTKRFFLV